MNHGLNDIEITDDKVKNALKQMSNQAAVGPDGLPPSVYKYGGQQIVKILSQNIQKVYGPI